MEDELKERLRSALAIKFEDLDRAKPGSEDEETLVKEIQSLVDALNKLNQTEMDAFDKQERRDIERDKNKAQSDLEHEKAAFDWKRAGFEVVKIVLPGAIGGGFYLLAQKRVLKFEEVGRIMSSAGHDLHLPNSLFKFWK